MSRTAEYLVQLTAGTVPLAAASLAGRAGAEISYHDDSAVIISAQRITSADQLPFANNVFLVLARVPRADPDAAARGLARRVRRLDPAEVPRSTPGFRVMVHVDGVLTPVGREPRQELESALGRRLGRRVDSRGSCDEFWVVGRTGLAEMLLCARLPKSKRAGRVRGSLAPELAAMLAAATRPDRRDVVLDPFGGRGALLIARAALPFRRLLYNDQALDGYREDLPGSWARDPAVTLTAEDARALPSVPDGSVDVLLTDPPWGEHEELDVPYEEFVAAMVATFDRVLHPRRGRLVLLTSRWTADQVAAALNQRGLSVGESVGILVNGHPATVIVARRSARDPAAREK